MRQRIGIAAALLRDPKLLLLDEPATGLDPAGMRDMRLLIRRLADQGMTVLLSSHLLAEVEELCNRVAIVRTGKIVYEGAIADLKRGAGAVYRLSTTNDERAMAVCRAQPGIGEVRVEHGRISFTADEPAVADLSQALIEAGALIRALAPQTVTLEDLFFSLTEGDGVVTGTSPAIPRAGVEARRDARTIEAAPGRRVAARPRVAARALRPSIAGSCSSSATRSGPTSGSARRRSCRSCSSSRSTSATTATTAETSRSRRT